MKRSLGVIATVLGVVLAGWMIERILAPRQETTSSPYAGLASVARVDAAFWEWVRAHEEAGGDHQVVIALGWSKGLSQEHTRATGRATLDLIEGRAELEVEGLEDPAFTDVWLVDNQPGPGRSVLPEPGDAFLRLGTLEPAGEQWMLHAEPGSELGAFEVDLIVVSRAGRHPIESRVLVGSAVLFQRFYSRARLARFPDRPPDAPVAAGLFGARPAFASALVPSLDPLVELGADLFFNETFDGNGRTCGTCHPAHNNLTIDPKFIARLPPDDPLFVAEFVPALAENFEKPILMRRLGLILENQDGFDDLENNFNMRSVPHTLALSTSLNPGNGPVPPLQRTGWSGDGAPGSGTLREFAIGAVVQHFPLTLARTPGLDFRLPTEEELDALEAFQLSLGRDQDLDLATLVLRGELPARGQEIFVTTDDMDGTVAAGRCNNCHASAGASVSFLPGSLNFNFDTGVELLADQPANLIDPDNNRPDGGFGQEPDPDRPGAFGDGTFNTPPLVEAADTPPFFHNNAVRTLEEAVGFYNSAAFNSSPAGQLVGGIQLEPTQVEAVAAFLRVINTLENIRSASETATFVKKQVIDAFTAHSLLTLAIAEVDDGIEVLDLGELHPDAVVALKEARSSLDIARLIADLLPLRDLYIGLALNRLIRARDALQAS